MEKLISIDLKASLGILKKPDINDSGDTRSRKQLYLTFNMLHKPALLGILGAVLGLKGYKESGKLPEYYLKLKNVKTGIQPLAEKIADFKGNFLKTVIQYKNGVGYASQEEGGNLIVVEQTLIHPAYRCYLLLDSSDSLQSNLVELLQQGQAEYLPYLGKNEYSLWWDNYREWLFRPFAFERDFIVNTIFIKQDEPIRPNIQIPLDRIDEEGEFQLPFITFERLPVGFHEQLKQYAYEEFVYTNSVLKKETRLKNLYELEESDGLIQLF